MANGKMLPTGCSEVHSADEFPVRTQRHNFDHHGDAWGSDEEITGANVDRKSTASLPSMPVVNRTNIVTHPYLEI